MRSPNVGGRTPREYDVLREMAWGRSDAAMVSTLRIAWSAAGKHVHAAVSKLELAPTRAALERRTAAVLTFSRGSGWLGGHAWRSFAYFVASARLRAARPATRTPCSGCMSSMPS